MLIRSQNKRELFVLEKISMVEVGPKYGKGETDWLIEINHQKTIGVYPSEKRAVEILDEICNTYQYAKECETTGVGASQPEFVYYMPENAD